MELNKSEEVGAKETLEVVEAATTVSEDCATELSVVETENDEVYSDDDVDERSVVSEDVTSEVGSEADETVSLGETTSEEVISEERGIEDDDDSVIGDVVVVSTDTGVEVELKAVSDDSTETAELEDSSELSVEVKDSDDSTGAAELEGSSELSVEAEDSDETVYTSEEDVVVGEDQVYDWKLEIVQVSEEDGSEEGVKTSDSEDGEDTVNVPIFEGLEEDILHHCEDCSCEVDSGVVDDESTLGVVETDDTDGEDTE